MVRSPRVTSYNSGVLYICESVAAPSDFRAVKNPVKKADICRIQKLNFKEMSRRERDFDFAESTGKTLDMKVRTQFHKSASTDKQAVIGDALYDIFQVDYDADRTKMYLFLQKARDLV